MGRRYRLSEKTKRFFLITLLLTPACYQIMPEIRMALVLAAMGEAVLSADRIWARNERFPFANLYDDRNPLYVRKMLKKRKCFSGINGYFVVQILLLSYVLLMTAGFISDHMKISGNQTGIFLDLLGNNNEPWCSGGILYPYL